MVPRGLVDQSKVKAGVQRAERALKPDVVRILYSYEEDWSGDLSLFFRVLLSDAASVPEKLRQTTRKIQTRILTEIKGDQLGLQTYFSFRSKSEQDALRERTWERNDSASKRPA